MTPTGNSTRMLIFHLSFSKFLMIVSRTFCCAKSFIYDLPQRISGIGYAAKSAHNSHFEKLLSTTRTFESASLYSISIYLNKSFTILPYGSNRIAPNCAVNVKKQANHSSRPHFMQTANRQNGFWSSILFRGPR